jgi:hypothetical protein
MAFRPVVCLLACGALLLESPIVKACMCSDRQLGISWPRAGASDVSLDAPLVVAAFKLDHVDAALLADDGSTIELIERRRLEAGRFECSSLSFSFLAPNTPLAPNTHYSFSVKNDSPGVPLAGGRLPQSFNQTVSFTTGMELRRSGQATVQMHVFGAEVEAERLLEVYVATDSREPTFAVANGDDNGLVTRDFDPVLIDERPYHVSLGAVECAEVTIVDVAGQIILSEERCQPNKCGRAGSVSHVCEEELSPDLVWTDWVALPDGCDASEVDSRAGVTTATGRAVGTTPSGNRELQTRSDADMGNGCGLAASSSGGIWSLGLLALVVTVQRRRREALLHS